jgi:transposase-like protein
MIICPNCQNTSRQVKVGRTQAGSQRYQCQHCGQKYTPVPKQQGYADEIRQQAVRLYVDGMNLRRIARHLGVVHQTVANWVQAYAATLPDTPPQPDTVTVVEQDELYTYIETKKTKSIS